jgi:hypothetical protein
VSNTTSAVVRDALHAADFVTKALENPHWKPNRAAAELLRNHIQALAALERAPIPAPGAWTEEQMDDAAKAFLAEHRRVWNQNLNAKESNIAGLRAALCTLNAAPGAGQIFDREKGAQAMCQIDHELNPVLMPPWDGASEDHRELYRRRFDAAITAPFTPPAQGHEIERIIAEAFDYGETNPIVEETAEKIRALYKPHVGAVGAGWKLVPREPTEEMAAAGSRAWSMDEYVWYAMYDAAPAQPSAHLEADVPAREEIDDLVRRLNTASVGRSMHEHDATSLFSEAADMIALLSPSSKEG